MWIGPQHTSFQGETIQSLTMGSLIYSRWVGKRFLALELVFKILS